MNDDRMALIELPQKSGDADFLRSVAEAVPQLLMDGTASSHSRRLTPLSSSGPNRRGTHAVRPAVERREAV